MKLRLHILALCLVLLFAGSGIAQQDLSIWPVRTLQDAAAATGNGTAIESAATGAVSVQITGTFSATVTFEGSIDGSNWIALMATNANDDSRATTATAAGIYSVVLNGSTSFRARISSYSSGNVTVKARLTSGSVVKLGGGGGGAPSGSAGGSLDGTYPNPGIATSVAGSGLSESTNVLAVNVDDSTIEISTDTLRVKDAGITNAKLAGSIAAAKLIGSDIATVGTITAGVWNGTAVGAQYGGTGLNTSASTGYPSLSAGTWSIVNATTLTAALDAVVGDSGAGGTKGLVPAPAAGDAAANKFLKADGTWAAAGGGLTVGSTAVGSGTNTRILYNNSGTLGEYTLTGTGTTVAMSAGPTFTGTATAATLSLSSLISTAVSPSQITTSQNDYAGATGFINRLDSDANDNIVSGMVAGTAGQVAYDINVGSFDLVYTHQSGNSSAANRFDNPGDMAFTLHPGDTVARIYDGTTQRWRLLSNPYVFAPNVTSGTGTTGSDHTSAGVIFKANSLTSGDGVAMSSSSVSSGNVLKIEATGTAAASNTKTALNVATSGANSSSGQQTYAAQFSNTSTGTSSQNYGVKVTVSGASTANIPLILSNGTSGDLIQLGGSGLTPYLGTGSGGPYFAGNAAGVTAILSMTYRAASTPLVILPSGGSLQWASGTAYTENGDTGMQRAAAGVIRINDGSTSSAPKTTAGSLIIGTSTGAIGSSGAGVLAFALSTAPSSSPADTVQMYSGDSAAGDHNLYTRNEGGEINRLTGLAARVSTQFDKTSDTALANVTGLTRNVEAGRTYAFTAVLYTTSNTSGGVKAAIGGTATATSIIYEAQTVDGSTVATVGTARATALGTTVGDVTAVAAARVTITGTIVVNAAGTLTVQFAQNASNGTASSVLVNSSFNLIPIG